MDGEERKIERMEEKARELGLTNKQNRRVVEYTVFYKIARIKLHNSLCFFICKCCSAFSEQQKTT